MEPQGSNLVAGRDSADGPRDLHAVDVRRDVDLEPAVAQATAGEVSAACAAAADAAPVLAGLAPGERAALLRAIADAVEADRDAIEAQADTETGLGAPRVHGELDRTTGQLRFLAAVVEDGGYLDAVVDRPSQGPSVRRVNRPRGPVAVFAASNFPLAFSVAGTDTAAALAVGCPAVVKAHPAHPLTSERTARAVVRGIAAVGAPAGAFSLLHGFEAGEWLVGDSRITAVGFTGSLSGGTGLAALAARRQVPIPVFAEMGSLNPVVVTAEALAARADEVLDGFVASFTLGTGQFCTKPGLLFVPEEGSAAVLDGLRSRLAAAPAGVLLSARIRDAWAERLASWAREGLPVREVVGPRDAGPEGVRATPRLYETTAAELRDASALAEEAFGPSAVVVRYSSLDELLAALAVVGGTLTGTVQAAGAGDAMAAPVLEQLRRQAGRCIWNGWPTGVAVTWAMHHGGPFPATTDPAHTSVGAAALDRFVVPVCHQGLPDDLLPPELQDANPLAIPRREDGRMVLPERAA